MIIKGNVIVTGANRGIGFSFVKYLSSLSTVDKVYAGCRNPENASDLIKLQKHNSKVKIIKLDVQNDLCIQLAAEQINYELDGSGINCLINNAGILEMSGSDFETPNRSSFWRHFDVNTIGAIVTTRLFLQLLRNAATPMIPSIVINISSAAGSISKVQCHPAALPTGNIVYGMSKAALNHFTVNLASMEKQNHIVAFSLAPTWTKTKIGGPAAAITPDKCAKSLLDVILRLKANDSGNFIDSDGNLLPF